MEYEHCCRCASSEDKQQIERYQTTTSRRAVNIGNEDETESPGRSDN